MKILEKIKKNILRPVILTIGNFDGIHQGHRKILKKVIEEAKVHRGYAIVVTFRPHPEQIFFPKAKFQFLNSDEEKEFLLKELGIDFLLVLKFKPFLARWSAEKFFQFLLRYLRLKKVIVGFNFSLGFERRGNLKKIKEIGRKSGFQVKEVFPEKFKNKIISSSLIRRLITQGDLEKAVLKLGGLYPVFGKVTPGKGLGRKLGFPTANIKINKYKLVPPDGVYLSRVLVEKSFYPALVNIKKTEFEVFILNFRGNLYGRNLKVFLQKKLRDEGNFKNQTELKKQIEKDIASAKKFFKKAL